MKRIDDLKEFFCHPWLCFDRSFSERGKMQLVWLGSVVLIVFVILLVLSYVFHLQEIDEAGQQMGNFLRTLTLFIDPGAVEKLQPQSHIFGVVVSVVGLVVMTGIFISVLSNMIDVRVDLVRNGETHYSLSGHLVIIGMDNLVPSLVDQLCHDAKYRGAYILVQTTMEAEEARARIHDVLEREMERRVIVYHGKRNSREDIERLNVTGALAVFVTGESGETDRDSLNIDSLRIIAELCCRRGVGKPLPVTVQFEYQTTFAAFQVTDLAAQWRRYIDFRPFNFYESWAKKVFVSRRYIYNGTEILYPMPDREPLDFDSDRTVHLIILGMSRMGVAMGTLAAHLLHFPNFCRDHSRKTRITFIDANADREMDFFRNRHRGLFEISSTLYRDCSTGTMTRRILPPTYFTGDDADFLDTEFDFIRGRAESPAIQDYLRREALDPGSLTTIVVCLQEVALNMEVALSLPGEVYDRQIPVFVRLKSSDALLSMLNQTDHRDGYSRYSRLYPFGMYENCYDLDDEQLDLAKWINYKYSPPSSSATQEDLWRRLPIALQWSNLYNAYSRGFKLRSFGIGAGRVLSETDIRLLCMVEHNRWCLEKLLLGYRKPHREEQEAIDSGGEVMEGGERMTVARHYKNRFVHCDLVPNEQLPESSLMHDQDVITGLLSKQ